jgi:hypothetical protein
MSLSRLAGSAIIAGVHGQADLVAAGGPQFEAALASFVTGNRLAGGVAGVVTGDELAVCFDPETQIGAIVLLNGTTASVALAMELAATARRLARSAPPAVRPPAPAPREYLPLLGIYARPGLGGWLLRLEWRDGKLTFTAGESAAWRLVLAPTGDPDTFTIESGADLTGERARFRRLAGGQVGSVLLMETTWERLEPAGA